MSEVHERPAETGALVTIRSALPTILAADTNDILGKLKSELDGFAGDATTERGRKEIASKAHKVSVAKQDLLRLAGTLKEGHRKVLNGIIAEEKLIVGQMDPLRDAVRKLLDDYEAIEAARVDAHRAALVEVEGWSSIPDDWTATQIADRIEELKAHPHLSREWQEFKDRAGTAAQNSYNALVAARVAAQEREVEAARLAEEERARAEAEALRLAQEEQARIERARAEAAAEATRVAEAAAVEQARKVEEAAQREREAAAERERLAAEALERSEQEASRLAAARVALVREQIAAIPEPEGYGATETSAELGARLDWLLRQNPETFEEFADEAAAVLAAEVERTRTLLTAARTREDEAEAERQTQRSDYHRSMLQHVIYCGLGMIGDSAQPYGILLYELENKIKFDEENFGDLLDEALEAKEAALGRLRIGMEAQAAREHERQREEAATHAAIAANAARETERRRQEAEAAEVEAARVKREKNVAHRAAINREVLAALVGCGMTEEIGRIVISSIVRGEVPHVTISY